MKENVETSYVEHVSSRASSRVLFRDELTRHEAVSWLVGRKARSVLATELGLSGENFACLVQRCANGKWLCCAGWKEAEGGESVIVPCIDTLSYYTK